MKNLKIRTPHNSGFISLDTPQIMGILNFTPDSFSDGGKYFDKTSALKHAEEMILQGAAIIDLGAESTRPNSLRISAEEEVKRLSEILPDLRKNFPDICISVDTYKEDVARYAVGEGADIVNDVFGGAFDCARDETNMYKTCAELKCPVVITHNKPRTFAKDVVKDLLDSAKIAQECGMPKSDIIIDCGFGFNKNAETNIDILKNICDNSELEYPHLLGVSRKSTLKKVAGLNLGDLDFATIAAYAFALAKCGADIFRTHNVRAAKICLDLFLLQNK